MKYVEERLLDFAKFNCCGDEDLFPFSCNACKHVMVFCYECDTLYGNLNTLDKQDFPVNYFDPLSPIFECPNCQNQFEYQFMQNPEYRCELDAWIKAGHQDLLVDF